jgi:hypothetical protein
MVAAQKLKRNSYKTFLPSASSLRQFVLGIRKRLGHKVFGLVRSDRVLGPTGLGRVKGRGFRLKRKYLYRYIPIPE